MTTTLLALLFALLPVQVQDLPPAFPRDGAKQWVDNERVTVWEATWTKGKTTAMHRHRYDMVGIDLADATVKANNAAGIAANSSIRRGNVFFTRKGVTDVQEGTSDVPRHAILVELKDVTVSPLPNTSGYVDAFPREGARILFENARVTVWDVPFTLGKPTPTHFHARDVVVVYLENGEMQSTAPGGEKTVSTSTSGQVKFNPRNRTHSELLVKGSQRVIAVELK